MRAHVVVLVAAAVTVMGAAAPPVMAGVQAVASPNPSSTDNMLHAVSAASASDAWAVGSYQNNTTGATDTLILHWDGTAWRRVKSPSPSPSNILYGVSAVSASDAWAVGTYQDNRGRGFTDTLILHWDGTAWRRVQSPSPSPSSTLSGVSADSGGDAWAVGSYYNYTTDVSDALILHWDGTAWTQVASPDSSSFGDYLYGVSAVSGSDAQAVGTYRYDSSGHDDTLILHWDGTAWTQVASPDPSLYNFLYGVSAVSGSDAQAVGGLAATTAPADTLTLHWDGTAWTQVASPSPASGFNQLHGVSADSGSDAWAVGIDGHGSIWRTLILHWDGTAWTKVKSPSPSSYENELGGVSAVSGSDAWAVGWYQDSPTSADDTLILHWNGTTWSRM